jgi:hypothetical protein
LAYLAEYDVRVGELALALREMVLNEAPRATETVFRGYALSTAYSFTEKWTEGFCHIVVYPRHVNIGFNRAAELDDPDRLLIGSGKIIRHLTVAEQDDLKKPYLRAFIGAAIKQSKAELAEKASQLPTRSTGKAAAKKRRSR